MRTEYLFTTEEKAELADIDRQMEMLNRRKFDIYMCANCRYIPESREGIDQIARIRDYLYSDRPLIPKHVIAIDYEEAAPYDNEKRL